MDLEAPESVRSMIGKKIDALEEQDRRALQYASIEGTEFLSTVLAGLLGVDEIDLEERLAHLEKTHRLIETLGEEELPDGALATRYRFAHALYQNFLYADLVAKRRAILHLQAGQRLAQYYGNRAPQIATQLAVHFERGRDFARAIEYLVHAGDNATKLYASAEAETHYSHALNLVEKLPVEEQASMSLGVYQKRGAVNMFMSRFAQAADDFTRMLERGRELGAAAQESAALNALVGALFFSHRLDEMAQRADEAVQAAERSGSETLRLEIMGLVAAKHNCYGELAESKPLLDDIIRAATSINHKPSLLGGLVWRGQMHFFQTEYQRAEEVMIETKRLAAELRDGFQLLHSLFFLGLIRANMGLMSQAFAALNEAIEMARRNGDHFWASRLPNCIGWIHRELQDFNHALEHDRQGVEVARADHVLEAESNSLINLGIDHLCAGHGEKTLPAFHEVEGIFKRDAWFRWRYNIRLQAAAAEYWLSQGQIEKAEAYARKLIEIATYYEAHKYIAIAHKLLAQTAIARGDASEAEKQLHAALEQLRDYPAPLVAWKTYAEFGRLKLQLGDGSAARVAFAQAAGIVNSIATNISDQNLHSTFMNSAAVREVSEGAKTALSEQSA